MTLTKNQYLERILRAFYDPNCEDRVAKLALQAVSDKISIPDDHDVNPTPFARRIRQLTFEQLEEIFLHSKVAFLNDIFRRVGPFPEIMIPGKILISSGVIHDPNRHEVFAAVRRFNEFRPEDDPYHQHDFGAIMVKDTRYYFKIDYYDHTGTCGVDPTKDEVFRVMTIMRADEY